MAAPRSVVIKRIRSPNDTRRVTDRHDARAGRWGRRLGAYDYLVKPFDVDDILMLVQRALEKRALERQVLCLRSALAGPAVHTPDKTFHGMVGRHPEMVRIYQLITQIAATPTTAL